MKCPQCQADNRIDRLYCDQCGAKLEHKLEDVRAAIDKEIRTEKADAAARGAKWLLAVSIILFFLGRGFRGCYKNLPENDIVAFASAPTVQIDDRITVKVTNFGVAIPKPKAIRPPIPAADKRNVEKELQDEAYRRAAVILKHRGSRTPITGVLLGDLILYPVPPKHKDPIPIHVADVRELTTTPLAGTWAIKAVNHPAALRVEIPNHRKVKIDILPTKPGEDPAEPKSIPLPAIESIKPLKPLAQD